MPPRHSKIAIPTIALALLGAYTLAACTTAPTAPPIASGCHADATQAYVGQAATPEVVQAIRKAAGASLVRALKPNQPATMDYRAERINILVDDDNRVLRATCG